MKRDGTRIGLVLYLVMTVGAPLGAQQVTTDPASTHIFPAGARRGTTVEVRVGGECLPPATRIRFSNPAIQCPDRLTTRALLCGEPSLRRKPGETHINYPKEWESRLTITADAPSGTHYWWLASGRGGSGARPFLVGDLPEFIETESNSSPDTAELVQLPMVVNGQIDGERDMDYFCLDAKEGEIIVADVMAARLGSPLDAVLAFVDAAGRRLPAQEVRVGSDPVLAVRAPSTGPLRFSIANLSTPGGPHFVYRINLSKEPYVRLAFPGGAQAGRRSELELLTLGGTRDFLRSKEFVQFPQSSATFWWTRPGAHNAIPLEVGRDTDSVEVEPNNQAAMALPIPNPAAVHGRFETVDDEDWFQFDAEVGKFYSVACQPAGCGLGILPIVSLCDAGGGVLVSASATDQPDRKPCIEAWTPPSTAKYLLRIRDVQQGVRGGSDFVYWATIREAQPDFEISLKIDAANLIVGGRAELDVLLRRRGGFNGPVAISAEGLPEGVRAEPLELPPNTPTGKLVLQSDAATTKLTDALIHVVGAADVGGTRITRTARVPHLGRDVEGVAIGPATLDQFHLTVQAKPLFRLFCSEAYQYAHRGTIYPYLMQVERFGGFQGPISLQVADRQIKDLDGIEVLNVTIPEGHNQVMLPLYLPETMHINVQAHSNVYAQGIAFFKDASGAEHSTCVVSEMRCMIRTLPTVARLHALDRELTVADGGQVQCRLHLDRTPLFRGPLHVSAKDLEASTGLLIEPCTIDPERDEAIVTIRAMPGFASAELAQVCLRGTGDLGDGATVVTETTVVIKRGE